MRIVIGAVARLTFYACFTIIVADALVTLGHRHEWNLFFWAAIGFPLTSLVWPWTHEAFGVPLWILGVAMIIGYPISTFIGGLDPV